MGRAVAPAGGGGRSLLVSLFYIANYVEKTQPDIACRVSERVPVGTVAAYVARCLDVDVRLVSLYARIYGLDMVELVPTDTLASVLTKYHAMSNWLNVEEGLVSLYYSLEGAPWL